MNNKPNILIFLSDQHNPGYSGVEGNKIVRTPNIDRIAKNGTVFRSAYTSCPLCVPSRVSMLTGKLPSNTGIFTNKGCIDEGRATFLHSLVLQGYETVLCGRMHFIGKDQRHGFTKRIMGDFTALHLGVNSKRKEELGAFNGTTSEKGCHKIVGEGISPVLEYDNAVINAALSYLKEPHDKPQCIVVGTYGPHFPYVAPTELYEYYKPLADIPISVGQGKNYLHPAIKHKAQIADDDKIKSIRAAYFGMITNIDVQVGQVYDAWKKHLGVYKKKGIFVYLSDHGDQAGEHNLYGKQTFFEGSARIPFIFEGDGIKKGCTIKGATSIMDLGPTICDLVGAAPVAFQDGYSVLNQLTIENCDDLERSILSEFVLDVNGFLIPGRMVRKGKWKLISYFSFEENDMIFDVDEDPYELHNLITKCSAKAIELKKILEHKWEPAKIIKEYRQKESNYNILTKWGSIVGGDESERWTIPKESVELPHKH